MLSAASTFLCGAVVGGVLYAVGTRPRNGYSEWLGRECWVRPASRPRWRRHVVVAVSWKGAVCVRDADRMSENGYWIKKQSVPFRVAFSDPGSEE